MEQYAFFKDRFDAGKKLAGEFTYLNSQRVVVLAVLNGGIPIGVEVAQSLACPLDVVLVQKLHLPNHPEVGFGAIGFDGTVQLNQDATETLKLTRAKIEETIQTMFEALKNKKARLAKMGPPQNLFFKTVILVDDGLTSGYTMLAAIGAVKKKNPKKIIVAVPTASAQGLELVKKQIEEVICLYIHPEHFSFKIESSYQNWRRLTDKEVAGILSQYQGRHD